MNQEIKNIAVKSAKLAGATFLAAGAVAFVASGAAVKAVTEGGKFLKDALEEIFKEEPAEAAEKAETEANTEADTEETVCEAPETPEEENCVAPEADETAHDEAAEASECTSFSENSEKTETK